jgi:hypothetical protein
MNVLHRLVEMGRIKVQHHLQKGLYLYPCQKSDLIRKRLYWELEAILNLEFQMDIVRRCFGSVIHKTGNADRALSSELDRVSDQVHQN